MPAWNTIWDTELLGNTLADWTLALLAFLVTFTVLPLLRGWIKSRRRRWAVAQRTQPVAIELAALLVERTSRLFLLAVAVYFAVTQLTLPHRAERAIEIATVFVFWFQLGRWAMAAVRFAVDRRRQRAAIPDAALAGSIEIIVFVAGVVVWTLALLLALDELGVEVKPLLAGLGIGGIAVALALQAVLGDLLASVSIALDKPFTVGDALVIEDFNGTVEYIGVKSTRLRSISGEQIIMSNSEVLKCRLRNYGRLRERRSAFAFTLMYDTPTAVLRAIPEAVRAIVQAQPHTRFDRCHLMAFAPTGLAYEVVYFVLLPDFRTYADLQQTINIAILERFRELGVQFATPPLRPRPTYAAPDRRAAAVLGPSGPRDTLPRSGGEQVGDDP